MPDDFQFDVFLSHSAKDRAVVRAVAERLRKDGLKVWFDEWVIEHGEHYVGKAEEGLEHSRVLVLCMTASASEADPMQREFCTFWFRNLMNKERRFISLRLDNAPIHGFLAEIPAISLLPQPTLPFDGAMFLAQFPATSLFPQDRELEYAKLLEACRPLTNPRAVSVQPAREQFLDDPMQRLCHELRVPAVAFRSALELVRRECEIKGYRFEHDYLTDLEMYSELLTRLLKEADILRYGPDRVPLNPRPVFFGRDILAPAIRFAEPFFRQRRLSIKQVRWRLETLPRLNVDPSALTQVAFNLIDNAIKYYDGKPASFVLDITAHHDSDSFEIQFADNGMGVLDQPSERLFDKGYRSTHARAADVTGNGIGLWISRELMLRHGGDLQLRHQSKPTVFAMLLPDTLAHRMPRL